MTAAEEYLAAARLLGPDAVRHVEEVRAGIGSDYAAFAFSRAADRLSNRAWREIRGDSKIALRDGGKGISVWRTKLVSPADLRDTLAFAIWIMCEETARPALRRASRICRKYGGTPLPDDHEDVERMIPKLRARRWETACAEMIAGRNRGEMQEAHYGLGAIMTEKGEVHPAFRPQG